MRVLSCLSLLQLLLLLIVFLFDLLELKLLLLLDLLLPGRIRILLLDFLLLLILLLLDLLIFLILFLLQLLDLFLVLLFQLRIHVVGRARSGRTFPIGVRICIGIRVRIDGGIWVRVGVRRPIFVYRGVHVWVGVRIDVGIWIRVGVRRPIVVYRSVHVRAGVRIDVHVWIHVGVRRPIVVRWGVNVWIVVYRRVHIRIDVGVRRAIVVLLHASVSWLRISRLNVSGLRTRGHSGGRRHPHRHYVVVGLLGLQLADLRIRNWLPFIGFDSCLTLRKRQRSGRRGRLGNNCTRLDRSGRLITHGGAATKNSLLRRHDGGPSNGYLRFGHFPLINPNHVAPNRLSGAEGLAGSRGDPACHTLVHISYVGNVFVDDGGVVIIVDHGLIHRRIRNVYVVDVGAA